MTEDKFNAIKAELFDRYGTLLCNDAKSDINAAADINELLCVLHKYIWDIWHKDFTATRFVRKWISADDIDVFNANGCYIDQQVTLRNPEQRKALFFGDCMVNVIVSEPHLYEYLLQDNTKMNVCAYGVCSVTVRTKKKAQVTIVHKDTVSRIKILPNK